MDVKLLSRLELYRCPHCGVSKPDLPSKHELRTQGHNQTKQRAWRIYSCSNCGGVVTACSSNFDNAVTHIFPSIPEIDESIPSPAREYLNQAQEAVYTPAGAVMLAASAVDAMLKAKGYKEGRLYDRIEKAQADHLITTEMARWAHEVRLDANEPRRADETAPLPTEEAAKKSVEFVLALAEFLFVLPARVKRGLDRAKEGKKD